MRKYTINSASFGVFILLILINGCMDPYDQRNNGPDANNKLYIQFTLPEGTLKTRGVPAEEGENSVNDLTLLFFEPAANGTGKFLGHYAVPEEDIPSENEMSGVMNNMFNLEITLTSGHKLSASAAYSILAAANMQGNYFGNMDSDLPGFISDIEQMTLHEVMVYTIMRVQGVGVDQGNDTKAVTMGNLPMSAVCQKAEKVARVECDLKRSVVRYDVVNKASGYRLVSASIWNAFPIGSVFDGVDIDYSMAPLMRYYGMKNPDGYDEIHGGLYSFENVSPDPDPKDEKTTCLIFGIAPEVTPASVSYYRVNISPKVTGQYLLRNNVYQVTISAVNKAGAGSEEDAYRDGEMNLDTSINSWGRDEDGLIIRDGDNLMALPTKRAVFGPEAEERQYFVYTLGEGTLEMSHLSMPSGMNAWLGGKGNDLYISVTSYAADERKGAIEIRFAGMKGVIEIIQNGREKKKLQLSYTNLPNWPAGSINVNAINGMPVYVESSGSWTAEIYNGNFSFDNNDPNKVILQGNNGDGIYSVFNTSINPNPENRHSFILVSLDDDPENYRNALVLTQLGIGGFTLNPSTTRVTFNADGSLAAGSNNFDEFEVLPGNPADTWNVSIKDLNGNPAPQFTYAYISGTIQGDQIRGPGKFKVSSPGGNYDQDIEAVLTVTHNGVNQKTIYLFKDSYDISLSHQNLTLPAQGGTTVAVSVNSNMTGAKWSATISSNLNTQKGLIPYLLDENGNQVTSLTSLDAGKSFRVYMPGINQHLTNQEQPKATVTVSLDGSTLTKQLVVTQEEVTYAPIYAQTVRSDVLGSWTGTQANFRVFGEWANQMTNSSNFGPSGTVYTQPTINTSPSGYLKVYVDNNGVQARIFNSNNAIYKFAGNMLSSVKNDPNTVYIIYDWDPNTNLIFNTFGLQGSYTIGTIVYVNENVPRKLNTDASVRDTELWKYIIENGPFGEVDPEEVALYPQYYERFMTYLTKWPSTFIPLMYAPQDNGQPNTGRVLLGVDPTHRIIWIGHKDLFGLDSGNVPNNWGNSHGDNKRFLQNLIAWMVNVNNYGDAFNDRFKVPKD